MLNVDIWAPKMSTLLKENGEQTPLVCLSEESIDPFLTTGCKDALELATMHSLAICDPAELFTYGPTQGMRSFRVALADFLTTQYGNDVESNNLMVTGGSTQALVLVCNVFLERGHTIFVEEPLAPKQLDILTSLGLKIIPVPVEDDGISLNRLEEMLSEVKKETSKPFASCLFLTPCYQNPTGISLSDEKCQELVKLIRKYNCLCLSNDIYHCISYERNKAPFGPPPKRLVLHDMSHQLSNGDTTGHVISIGSLSTIFCPGLRMGWIEAFPNILEYLKNSAFVRHCGASQHYLCGVMESVLSLGVMKDSLESLRLTFHTRMERLCDSVATILPQCTFRKPKGGFFLWLSLPSSIDSEDLQTICKKKYQLDFLPGIMFSCGSKKFKNHLRLSISRYGDQTLLNAVTRLSQAVKELQLEMK